MRRRQGGEKQREGGRDVVLLRLLSKIEVVLQLLASMVASMVAVPVAWQLKGSKTSAADVSV